MPEGYSDLRGLQIGHSWRIGLGTARDQLLALSHLGRNPYLQALRNNE
jgi:hypothetical protein